MQSLNPCIHSHTPRLAVIDNRSLPVRQVAYWRRDTSLLPEARVTVRQHDAAGRAIAQQDPRLVTDASAPANLATSYSLSGKVLSTTSVDAGWRVSLLGEADQAVQDWDGRGSQRWMEYDEQLRAQAVFEQRADDPRVCTERYRYGGADPACASHNQCGKLIRHDDPAGTQLFAEYGVIGGVLQQTRQLLRDLASPDWPERETDRDALLEPDTEAMTRSSYNGLGEVIAQTDAKDNRQLFSQTIAGQLREVRLQVASEMAPITLVSSIEYNAHGQTAREVAGNGVITTLDYAPEDGRLSRLLAKRGNTPLQDLRYEYDAAGNVLSIEDAAQPIRYFANQRIEPVSRYGYDSLYQLVEATGWEAGEANRGPRFSSFNDPAPRANYRQTYHYDAGGNLLELIHEGPQSHGHRLVAQVHSNRCLPVHEGVEPGEEDFHRGFDANGNLLSLQPGQALSWDLRNQLREVRPVARDAGPDDVECYVYGADGMRVRKVSLTQTNALTLRAEVRYLPNLELRTHSGTGEVLQVISVQAGRSTIRVLHWEQAPSRATVSDQYRYSLNDHLGSCSLELDSAGEVISQEGYHPFGTTAWFADRGEVEVGYKTVRYSGKERDATGLYYYGFRYYVPWLQRWASPDPAGTIDGLNLFRMVRNNPLTLIDSDGLAPTKPVALSLPPPPPPPPPPPSKLDRSPQFSSGKVQESLAQYQFSPIVLSPPNLPGNEPSQAWKSTDYVDIGKLANTISHMFGVPERPIVIADVSHEALFEKINSYTGQGEIKFDKEKRSEHPAAWTSPKGVVYMGVTAPDYSEGGSLDVDKIRSTVVHESLHFFSHQHVGFQAGTDTAITNSNYDEYVTDYLAEKVFNAMYPGSTYKTGYFTKNLDGGFVQWGGNMAKFMIDSGHVGEHELVNAYFGTGKLKPMPDQSLTKWKALARNNISKN
jgi:insecticidal toxin complex protein TccC